jgi:hypothetical protein
MPGSAGDETGERETVQMSALTIPAERWSGGGGERSVQLRALQTNAWMDGAVRPDLDQVHAAAEHGVSGSGGRLPHHDAIQRSFGGHDVSHVRAHVGGAASEGTRAMGAQAYAIGDQVAFGGAPDLHTAAHEAAHVVQQRAGVQLTGGVGQVGDAYERHADAVADKVVRGESAESLLDEMSGTGGGKAIQMIATYGGEWDANPYENYSSGSLRGARIEITFTPNDLVASPKIGLTQTIKAQKDGAAYTAIGDALEGGDRGARANTAQQGDEGRHIDRAGERTNPLYGIDNPGANEPLGQTTTSSGANARFGHRNLVPNAAADVAPAWMFDRPALRWRGAGATLEQKFETTALVLEGPMTGTYLGSVEWGTQTDAAGTPTTMPFRVVSMGAPTQDFMTSVNNWNAAHVWVRDRVVAPSAATVTSLQALVPGTAYPANTLYMTLTPTAQGAAPVEIRSPIAATFDSFLVAQGAAVPAGRQLAVYRTQEDTADMATTTHVTVDPTTLDDAGLETRMRTLCDEILHMDRTSTDYQNKRFEIRGLGREAVRRGHDAVDSGHTYTVRGGDTLWGIAQQHLGGGARWTRIMALNAADLQDPNIVTAGRVLKMPAPYHP